ncbi:hypothetical protein HDU91_005342 [Kappamyces sp. JEL0680]|nr:hypothetical protein HDU91_005342 [Kappamyces sp. JEL0680]
MLILCDFTSHQIQCRWPVGTGLHAGLALGLDGSSYSSASGKGCQIQLVPCQEAPEFVLDPCKGQAGIFALRLASHLDLALEIDYRKIERGTSLSLWCNFGPGGKPLKQLASTFCFDPKEGLLCPAGRTDLCVGLQAKKIVLVSRARKELVLVFQPSDETQPSTLHRPLAVADQYSAAVELLLDGAARRELREDGFTVLRSAIEPHLLQPAKAAVNKRLGQCCRSPNALLSDHSQEKPVLDAFNLSIVPRLLERIFGPGDYTTHSPIQVATNFPGDLCLPGTLSSSAEHFRLLSEEWHIDGIPNAFHRGSGQDHFGSIRNFDCLVGILLTDTPQPMMGELCVYQSSHLLLSRHFKETGLQKVKNDGMAALPTGSKTSAVLGDRIQHVLGRAGDVVVANYLTAHFIAPNCSSEIRSVLYVRVKSPRSSGDTSLLDPLFHWSL